MKQLIEALTNPKFNRLYFIGIWVLLCTKLLIHLISAQNYGFHRDELLHLAVGKHLDFGYMEFPPMIAWLSALIQNTLGDSLFALRLLPALSGVFILYLVYLMAKELTENYFGQFLAVLCAFISVAYFRNHTLFQPLVFDQVFWALSFFFLLKYINTKKDKFLVYLGICLGFGILTKYTIIFWILGVVIASLFTEYRKIYQKQIVWKSAGLTFLIVLPNLLWQVFHNFPALKHIQVLRDKANFNVGEFFLEQLISMNEFSFFLAFTVIFFLLFSPKLKKYRLFGFMFPIVVILMLIAKTKSYYLFAIYPIYFAFVGKIFVELLQGNFIVFRGILVSVSLAWGLFLMPFGTPILSVENFVNYGELKKSNNRVILPNNYADMFGWEEQVSELAKIYHQSFSEEEKKNCVIWAKNYGEAGAILKYAKKYKLPNPISKHGSFWLWGSGDNDAKIALCIGWEKPFLKNFYNEIQEIKRIKIPYVIEEEYNIPISICYQPKISLSKFWSKFAEGVFD